jgi:hypothetical protein
MNPINLQTQFFTTGQVAKMCRVAMRTVAKWTDGGKLQCHRVPLSQNRRIPRDGLIAFLRKYNFPVPPELDDSQIPTVLIVSADAILVERCNRELCSGYVVRSATTGIAAGALANEHTPAAAIVDYSIGIIEARQISSWLRESLDAQTPIFAVLPEGDGWSGSVDRGCVTECWRKPLGDIAALCERIKTLAGAVQ